MLAAPPLTAATASITVHYAQHGNPSWKAAALIAPAVIAPLIPVSLGIWGIGMTGLWDIKAQNTFHAIGQLVESNADERTMLCR
jgi:hypothetical protein